MLFPGVVEMSGIVGTSAIGGSSWADAGRPRRSRWRSTALAKSIYCLSRRSTVDVSLAVLEKLRHAHRSPTPIAPGAMWTASVRVMQILTATRSYDHVTMGSDQRHRYCVQVTWTGNLGQGTSSYRAYSRNHDISVTGKPPLPGSSDPGFRGDPERYNPEELLVSLALRVPHALVPASVRRSQDRRVASTWMRHPGSWWKRRMAAGDSRRWCSRLSWSLPQVETSIGLNDCMSAHITCALSPTP